MFVRCATVQRFPQLESSAGSSVASTMCVVCTVYIAHPISHEEIISLVMAVVVVIVGWLAIKVGEHNTRKCRVFPPRRRHDNGTIICT